MGPTESDDAIVGAGATGPVSGDASSGIPPSRSESSASAPTSPAMPASATTAPPPGAPPPPPNDVAGLSIPRLHGGAGGRRRTVKPVEGDGERRHLTPAQRLLVLDSWMKSRLPATEFASLVGVSKHTLYTWKQRFEERGPAGLSDRANAKRGGSRMPEATKRAILMLKEAHPDWGQDRLHDVLLRSEGYGASPGAIALVLEEAGYVTEHEPTRPHEPEVKTFERARPNQLWQTDLFTFLLRRENRRVHLVGFMDDHSRYLVGYGLHASASGAMVREVLEAAIANYGAPEEVLTDNGPQYKTWRGVSAFTRLLERRGIRQVVASPRRPQTLGKAERFWGTLWRELLEGAIFQGIDDARLRIGQFIDYYNFQRPHQGIDSHVPADRYFASAPQVKATLSARVRSNAKDLAQHGVPRKPFYLTGRVGDRSISLHAEGEKVVLVEEGRAREEVDLSASGRRAEEVSAESVPTPVAVTAIVSDAADLDDAEEEPAPGSSPLDAFGAASGPLTMPVPATPETARVDGPALSPPPLASEGGAS